MLPIPVVNTDLGTILEANFKNCDFPVPDMNNIQHRVPGQNKHGLCSKSNMVIDYLGHQQAAGATRHASPLSHYQIRRLLWKHCCYTIPGTVHHVYHDDALAVNAAEVMYQQATYTLSFTYRLTPIYRKTRIVSMLTLTPPASTNATAIFISKRPNIPGHMLAMIRLRPRSGQHSCLFQNRSNSRLCYGTNVAL